MNIPTHVPVKGFYYHYKHDPNGPVNNYAYELLGIGVHTEYDDGNVVVYLPLYDSATVYQNGKLLQVRPIEMWSEPVRAINGKTLRFNLITDESVIAQLQEIKEQLYK